MLRRVSQASHLRVSVVTANDVKRLHNHNQHHAIDEHEFEWTNEENVATEISRKSIKTDPTGDIAQH